VIPVAATTAPARVTTDTDGSTSPAAHDNERSAGITLGYAHL
jgi:hypothetical protein